MSSVLQKATRRASIARDARRPRVVVEPGMRRILLFGNRELSTLSVGVIARTASGRPEAIADDERPGEVGPAHSSWEAGERSGASREGVSGAKGRDQMDLQNTVRTQSREAVSRAQARIREALTRNKTERLTTLLPHITLDVLRAGFFSLKKTAAPGIDGMTWVHYAGKWRSNA